MNKYDSVHASYAVYALNLVSALAVVFLHTSLAVFAPQTDPHWHLDVLLQSLCIFAVPVFFAISGMNLLHYRTRCSTKTFFIKRLKRVGSALLFGSLLCYFVYGLFPNSFYGTSGASLSFFGFLKGFLSNSINDTYWFFYTLIYLYLLTPLLAFIADKKRALQYVLALCLIAAVFVPCMQEAGIPSKYLSPLFGWGAFSSVALIYYIGGFYVKQYMSEPNKTWPYVLGFLASAACMYVLTCVTNMPTTSAYNSFFASITSPFCLLEAFCLFQSGRSLERRLQRLTNRAKHTLAFFSRGALGVYLIQMLFVNYLGWQIDNPILKGIIIFVISLVVSLLFISLKQFFLRYVMRKVSE